MLAQFLIPPAHRASAQHFRGPPPAKAECVFRSGEFGVAVFVRSVIIGPGKRCTVRIGNASITAPNLKVYELDGRWFQQAANSSNSESVPLPPGSELSFDGISVIFEPVNDSGAPESPRPAVTNTETPAKRGADATSQPAKRPSAKGHSDQSIDSASSGASPQNEVSNSNSQNANFEPYSPSSDSEIEEIQTPISSRPVPRPQSVPRQNQTPVQRNLPESRSVPRYMPHNNPHGSPHGSPYGSPRTTPTGSDLGPQSVPRPQPVSTPTPKPVPQFAPQSSNRSINQSAQPVQPVQPVQPAAPNFQALVNYEHQSAHQSASRNRTPVNEHPRLMESIATTPQYTPRPSVNNTNSRHNRLTGSPSSPPIDQTQNILDVLNEHTTAIKDLKSEVGKLASSINTMNMKLAKTVSVNESNNQAASAAIAAQIEVSNSQQSSALQHLFQASFSKLQTVITQSQQACNSKIDELIVMHTNAEE